MFTFGHAKLLSLTIVGLGISSCRESSTGVRTPAALQVAAEEIPHFSDWSAPVNLGAVVNSELEELDPIVSKDGLSLYFGSLRAGGYGGVDIWVSQRASVDAPWGSAQNLGPTINTPFNDGQPALSLDGHRLYFNSNRPGGFGAADLYVSHRHDKRDELAWEAPANLGHVINTAAGESGPTLFEDDATGTVTMYFASNRPGGGSAATTSTPARGSTMEPLVRRCSSRSSRRARTTARRPSDGTVWKSSSPPSDRASSVSRTFGSRRAAVLQIRGPRRQTWDLSSIP